MYASYPINKGKIVLSIEDSKIDYELLRLRLKNTGFESEWAEDANTALQMLGKKEYYAITCDNNLLGMDGRSLCIKINDSFKEARRARPHIVFITGAPREDDARFLMREGAVDVFTDKRTILNGENKGQLANLIEDIERVRKLKHNIELNESLIIGRDDNFMRESLEAIVGNKGRPYFLEMEPAFERLTSGMFYDYLKRVGSDPDSGRAELGIEKVLKIVGKNNVRVVAGAPPGLRDTIKFFYPYVSVIGDISHLGSPDKVAAAINTGSLGWMQKIKGLKEDYRPDKKEYKPNIIFVTGLTAAGKSTLVKGAESMNPLSQSIMRLCGRDPRIGEINGDEKLLVYNEYFPEHEDEFAFYHLHKNRVSFIGVRKEDINKFYHQKRDLIIPVPDPDCLDRAMSFFQDVMECPPLTGRKYADPKIVIVSSDIKTIEERQNRRGGWVAGDWQETIVSKDKLLSGRDPFADLKKSIRADPSKGYLIETTDSGNYLSELLAAKELANYMHITRFNEHERFRRCIDDIADYF